MRDQAAIDQILSLIRDEWQAIPPEYAPWGVWIAQYPPIPADARDAPQQSQSDGSPVSASVSFSANADIPYPRRSVLRAWLLQGADLPTQERDIWEYLRFWVVHFERPWDPYYLAPGDPRFDRTYELGLGAFAPYAGSEDWYLETIWGSLWGRGRRVRKMPSGGLAENEVLWVS